MKKNRWMTVKLIMISHPSLLALNWIHTQICLLRVSLRRKPLLSLVIPVIVLQWSQKWTISLSNWERLQRSPIGFRDIICPCLRVQAVNLLLWHMALIKSPALIIFIPGLPPTFLKKLINLKFMGGLLLQPIFFWKKSIESGISNIQKNKFSWLYLTSCFTKRGEHLGENYSITWNFQRKYHS